MLSFREIYTQVGRFVQDTSSGRATKIKDRINARYRIAANRHNWSELDRRATVTLTAGADTVTMPKDVDLIYLILQNATPQVLANESRVNMYRRHGTTITQQDKPLEYADAGTTGARNQPTSASVITVVSSSASDTSIIVRVQGFVSGELLTEAITLTGTTPVAGTNTFTEIVRVSKDDATVGVITFTSNAAAVTNATLGPREFTAVYRKIQLYRVPNAADTITILYKMRVPRLVNDEDVPILPIEDYLIHGAYADMLREQRQFSKATTSDRDAEEALIRVLARFVQEENIQQAMPHIQRGEDDFRRAVVVTGT